MEFASCAAVKASQKPFIVYKNRVLDVSAFTHPGPPEYITDNIGNDVTELFDGQGHSNYALELCESLTVGRITVKDGVLDTLISNMTEEEREIHKRLDELIDVKQPLIPQVKKLSNEEFIAFVRRPRKIDNEDGIQLYACPKKDALMKTSLSVNSALVLPSVVLALALAFKASDSLPDFLYGFALYFNFGLTIMWTFVEYFHHRFVLHTDCFMDPKKPADGDRNAKRFVKHLHHHVFMNQRYRMALPAYLYPVYALPSWCFLTYCRMNEVAMYCFLAGWVLGSLLYDVLHLSFHFDDILPHWMVCTSWFQHLRAGHMRHHLRDNRYVFGVTNNFWDRLLSSMDK